jgi:putative ABC transport system ATP-binding protein
VINQALKQGDDYVQEVGEIFMSSVIKGIQINKSYGNSYGKVDILKNIDIDIIKGTLNVLMGPSGSGKTTLMNQLSMLDRPNSGQIMIEEEEVTSLCDSRRDELRRHKTGFIFQSVALVSKMTAFENVDFTLRITGYNSKERYQRVEECLKIVGLQKRMHHMPQELSGGEQQRVAIARAIAHKPSILFADEPTAELDVDTGLKIIKIFKNLMEQEGITIVMTSHDPNMADIADRLFYLEDGRIKLP